MASPRFEVADVLRLPGDAFFKRYPQPPHIYSALDGQPRAVRPLSPAHHPSCRGATGNKTWALKIIRKSIGQQPPVEKQEVPRETPAEKILRLTGLDITRCPKFREA